MQTRLNPKETYKSITQGSTDYRKDEQKEATMV